LKNADPRLFKKVQKARDKSILRLRQDRLEAYLPVRWSEAIERNEAGGPFSIAC
jgi:hypothetical protein